MDELVYYQPELTATVYLSGRMLNSNGGDGEFEPSMDLVLIVDYFEGTLMMSIPIYLN